MMKKTIILILSALTLCSCYLDNRMPDPVYVALIKSLKAEGALSVKIDEKNMTVVIDMEETYDLTRVKIDSCHFNNDSLVKPSVPINGIQDLSTPLKVILRTYQDYEWTISATQTDILKFTVKRQMGKSVIDSVNNTVTFGVPETVGLNNIEVLTCKLGPAGATTYDPDPTTIHDFTNPVTISVTSREKVENWTLSATIQHPEFVQISPRAKCTYLKAILSDSPGSSIEYREKGSGTWIHVDSLTITEGEGIGYVENLTPSSEYECRALAEGEISDVSSFTTTATTQLPNAGFNVYSKAEDPKYYSFFDPSSSEKSCQTKWWDAGNEGSTIMKGEDAVTIPNTTDFKEGKASVQMISRFVGLLGIGKFAAGNFFAGQFGELHGMNGTVLFGRPFTERPKALRLWIKYVNGPIDHYNGSPKTDPMKEGDPDFGLIYIALGDWDAKTYGGTDDCPVLIDTGDESTFFKADGPNVIAYGTFRTYKPMEWTEIEIPFDYHDNFRIPTHILISCASSGYGDYFTGSTKSSMWVDDFRLIY